MVKLLPQHISASEVPEWNGLHLVHGSPSSCLAKVRLLLRLKGSNRWPGHIESNDIIIHLEGISRGRP